MYHLPTDKENPIAIDGPSTIGRLVGDREKVHSYVFRVPRSTSTDRYPQMVNRTETLLNNFCKVNENLRQDTIHRIKSKEGVLELLKQETELMKNVKVAIVTKRNAVASESGWDVKKSCVFRYNIGERGKY